MNDSEYVRLRAKPKKAFIEGSGSPYLFPFPKNGASPLGKRDSSIQLPLTESFPIFNFAQTF